MYTAVEIRSAGLGPGPGLAEAEAEAGAGAAGVAVAALESPATNGRPVTVTTAATPTARIDSRPRAMDVVRMGPSVQDDGSRCGASRTTIVPTVTDAHPA
jgi:hypothetical protein